MAININICCLWGVFYAAYAIIVFLKVASNKMDRYNSTNFLGSNVFFSWI